MPIPPLTDTINGAGVSVKGKLLTLTPEWIVLDMGNSKVWVPRENVLLLQFR